MLATYSFKCPTCGTRAERFVHRDAREQQQCPECTSLMQQVITSAPRLDWLGMAQGENAGPEFIDRFTKMHRDRAVHEHKTEQEHGDYGPAAGS